MIPLIVTNAKYPIKGTVTIKYLLCFALAALILSGCSDHTKTLQNKAAVKKLEELLDKKEYFRLETQFQLCAGKLDNKDRLYFKAFIDNAFNRNIECINDIDSLLKNDQLRTPDSARAVLKVLQTDSYFKSFQYAKAAKNDSSIVKDYAHTLPKEEIDDIKNDFIKAGALSGVPAQQTVIKRNASIPWTKDKLGLIEIPLISHGHGFNGIFDTRANISSITQTYARKLGLHVLNATYNEGSGATGITFKTGIGVADSLLIGDIVVRNAVFQVMPDSILYIAPVKFQLNIIIGFPVIEQLQEVDLFKDGHMVIPSTPTKSGLHNLALDALDPVILLKSGNDSLSFYFDSGAVTTDLYSAYFERYKKLILKTAIKKKAEFGGAGGTQKKDVYILPEFNAMLGNEPAAMDSVSILTKKIYPKERFYGNLGQDFMANFSELAFNFKYMYVKGVK